MEYRPVEAKILAALFALETRAEEWWDGRSHKLTQARLREHVERFWQGSPEPWQEALEALEQQGLVQESDGELGLTRHGRGPAAELRTAFLRQRFGEVLRQAERSATYRTFYLRTSDLDLRAFSPLDRVQLNALLALLGLEPRHRLLDAGCGAGHVAEEICRRTGCSVTGVDHAPEALEIARRRTVDEPRLEFVVHDLGGLPEVLGGEEPAGFDAVGFDAVVAIDSLAFLDDLHQAIRGLVRVVRPGGVLVIMGLEVADDIATAATAQALTSLDLPYRQVDLTAQVVPILRARQFAARALYARFRAEGNDLLGRSLVQESERLGPHLEAGRLRRLLYRVSIG